MCNAFGCLHHVYEAKSGDYRLVWSGYVRDVQLEQLGNALRLK
jgi:hypothetical protein